MTTEHDEIIEEIRRLREAHAASLDYDLKRITEDLQRQEPRVSVGRPLRPDPPVHCEGRTL